MMKPKAYTDDYGDDIPTKGIIAYDSKHIDVVIHGFNHHKAEHQKKADALQYWMDVRKEANDSIRHLRKQLKNS